MALFTRVTDYARNRGVKRSHLSSEAVNGKFFGVSSGGGGYRGRDAMEIDTSGRVRVIYAFHDSGGSDPGWLLDYKGALFGEMRWGSPKNGGTIYRLMMSNCYQRKTIEPLPFARYHPCQLWKANALGSMYDEPPPPPPPVWPYSPEKPAPPPPPPPPP
jgi:hypothetical protein